MYNRFLKYFLQQIRYALRCLDRCDHQQIAVHLRPVDVVSGVADELCQESPLGASIALPKGVAVLDFSSNVFEHCLNFFGELFKSAVFERRGNIRFFEEFVVILLAALFHKSYIAGESIVIILEGGKKEAESRRLREAVVNVVER